MIQDRQFNLQLDQTAFRNVKIELFAWNLRHPSHMEWMPDGRLLVSEHTQGVLRDITRGGDAHEAEAFVTGLRGPAAMMPLEDGRLMVAEAWGGRVTEVSQGGNAAELPTFAGGLTTPYTLASFGSGGTQRYFVSERPSRFRSQITELFDSGETEAFIQDMPARLGEAGMVPPESWPNDWERFAAAGCVVNWIPPSPKGDDHLYVAVGSVGEVLKVPINEGGGRYFDLIEQGHLLAWDLQRLGGMHFNPLDGLLYAVQPDLGNVIVLDPVSPRNYRFTPPVVQGLRMPTCVRFADDGESLLICSIAEGVVWKVSNFR